MGSRPSVESARGGASRQISLCPAEPFALVHRQYRHSPHPSFVQPNPLLPTATRATRLPGSQRHRPANPTAELQVCATGAVGRRPRAPGLFPGGTPALHFSLKAMESTALVRWAQRQAMGGAPRRSRNPRVSRKTAALGVETRRLQLISDSPAGAPAAPRTELS